MTRNYASFKLRWVASLLDFMLCMLIISAIVYFITNQSSASSMITSAVIFLVVLFNPVILYYHVPFTYYFGGTPGKLLLGLRIIPEIENKLTFKQVLFRQTIGYMFSWTFFGLGYLAVIKDDKKQSWHDKASATVITRKGNTFVIGLMLLIVTFILTVSIFARAAAKFEFSPLNQLIQMKEIEESMKSKSNQNPINE